MRRPQAGARRKCVTPWLALTGITTVALWLTTPGPLTAQSPWHPPELSGGLAVATDRSPEFLKPVGPLASGVAVAKTPPTVDFLFYPEQTYPGHPWSVWGDGVATVGKYYSAI